MTDIVISYRSLPYQEAIRLRDWCKVALMDKMVEGDSMLAQNGISAPYARQAKDLIMDAFSTPVMEVLNTIISRFCQSFSDDYEVNQTISAVKDEWEEFKTTYFPYYQKRYLCVAVHGQRALLYDVTDMSHDEVIDYLMGHSTTPM